MNRFPLFLLVLIALTGCQSHTTPPAPASQPAPIAAAAPQRFENKDAGITFNYPAGWKPAGATATQFKFTGPSNLELTLEVPKLPIHIPNLIPIDSVRDGYVDDYKKRVPDAQAVNLPDPTIADAKQHRVKLTGHQNGATVIDEAATLVHGDKVYILSTDCDEKNYPGAKAALDLVVQSVQWSK